MTARKDNNPFKPWMGFVLTLALTIAGWISTSARQSTQTQQNTLDIKADHEDIAKIRDTMQSQVQTQQLLDNMQKQLDSQDRKLDIIIAQSMARGDAMKAKNPPKFTPEPQAVDASQLTDTQQVVATETPQGEPPNMSILDIALTALQLAPSIVAGVELIHGPGNGLSKLDKAKDDLKLATAGATALLANEGDADVPAKVDSALEGIINTWVAIFNKNGIFKHSTPAAAPAAASA